MNERNPASTILEWKLNQMIEQVICRNRSIRTRMKRGETENWEKLLYLTTCGSLDSILSNETSRRVVGGTPSSSSWRRVFFNATIFPVAFSLALYTLPYVPSPTFSSFSNASIADFGFSSISLSSLCVCVCARFKISVSVNGGIYTHIATGNYNGNIFEIQMFSKFKYHKWGLNPQITPGGAFGFGRFALYAE